MHARHFEVRTTADGSIIIHPTGPVGPDDAVELRQTVVHTVRHLRPLRMVLDLADVTAIDSINIGTLAEACTLGDDHHVIVFVDNPRPELAAVLQAAGVPDHRVRYLSRG